MKIAIGNDHAGVEVKKNIEKLLSEKGYTVINKGYDGKESVDYPDYIHPVSLEVKEKKAQIGIIICGSGNCDIWIMFYRKNSKNVIQNLKGNWYNRAF